MKNTKGQNKVIIFIIAIIIITAGAYWLAKGNFLSNKNQPSSSDSQISIIEQSAQPNDAHQVFKTLFYAVNQGENINISTINLESLQKKLIFTDADETLKIKRLSNIGGNSILALMGPKGDAPTAALYSISLDGKGNKTKLQNEVTTLTSPSLSPDGKNISLIEFSNAEKDFGYSVISENLDGTDKKIVYKNPSPLSFLTFKQDGAKLAVVKTTQSGSEIIIVNLADLKPQTIYKTQDEQISYLNWTSSGLTFSKSPTKNAKNTTDIYSCDEQGNNLKKISALSTVKTFPLISPDGLNLTYISKNNLILYNINEAKEQNLTVASQILGWLP